MQGQNGPALAPRIMMVTNGVSSPLSFAGPGAAPPLINSLGTQWRGVPFEVHQTTPTDGAPTLSPLAGEYQLRIMLEGSIEGLWSSGSTRRPFAASPGSVTLHSGEFDGMVQVRGKARTLVVRIDPDWLARTTGQGSLPETGIHRLPGFHETARLLGLAMCAEVSEGAASGALFAESLTVSLLNYCLQRAPLQPLPVRGELSAQHRQRLRAYIQAHLAQDLTLERLASTCGLKARHFSTLFRRAFGVTPHQYVLACRLERGARLLEAGDHAIAEVALLTGFASQSHFTTAFRRAHGLTPRRYVTERRFSVVMGDALGSLETSEIN